MKKINIGLAVAGLVLASGSSFANDGNFAYERSYLLTNTDLNGASTDEQAHFFSEVHSNVYPREAQKKLSPSEGLKSSEVSMIVGRYHDAIKNLQDQNEKAQFSYLFIEKISSMTPVTAGIAGQSDKKYFNVVAWGTTSRASLTGNNIPVVNLGETSLESIQEYKNLILDSREKAVTNKKLLILLDQVFTKKKSSLLKRVNESPIALQNNEGDPCEANDCETEADYQDWAEEQGRGWCNGCTVTWFTHPSGERYLRIESPYGSYWDAYHYWPSGFV